MKRTYSSICEYGSAACILCDFIPIEPPPRDEPREAPLEVAPEYEDITKKYCYFTYHSIEKNVKVPLPIPRPVPPLPPLAEPRWVEAAGPPRLLPEPRPR